MSCNINNATLTFNDNFHYTIYHVITPIYFIIGLFANIILFIAFYKQSQTETAYVYQIFVTISKTFEIINFTIFVFLWKWLGDNPDPHAYLKNIYALAWYTAKISNFLLNSLITTSLLLSLAMAADRLSALIKPFEYKTKNHRFYHILTALVCVAIGIGSSWFLAMRYQIISDDQGYYKISVNTSGYTILTNTILTNFPTIIRIVGITILIILNILMTITYQKNSKKVALATTNNTKEKNRKEIEKILLLLTIWQSILTCFAVIPISIYYVVAIAAPRFAYCWIKILGPSADGSLAIGDSINVFVVLIINKKCRKMIFDVFRCGEQANSQAVV